MAIKKLTIEGLRGFSKREEINFAMPDGKNYGSGLTVLIGPNNSGKSTVMESVHLLSIDTDIIPLTARNSIANGIVKIEAIDNFENKYSLTTTANGGAFIERRYNEKTQEYWSNRLNTFILTSKRNFSSTFSNNNFQTRENYTSNIGNAEYRNEGNINNNFGGRLLTIYKNRKNFEKCLAKVVSPIPDWTIESAGSNSLYLEFSFNNVRHSSNGAGDGYINIFNIVDSLYDSTENNVILIDEPEISLHPDLQRKLFNLLVEYSKDKQIIISTHSPYFVDWELFSKNAKIIRFKKEKDSIKTYELTPQTKEGIKKLISDSQHPHILSLTANEIFFLNDNVILTEGQDDVLCYKKIFEQYNFCPNASFFGWGAGGAGKIEFILDILKDLGYMNVFVILDNDKKDNVKVITKKYPNYQCYAIATHDVRNKDRIKKVDNLIKEIEVMEFDKTYKNKIISMLEMNFPNIEGLITNMKNYDINLNYNDDILSLVNSIKKYFPTEEYVQVNQSEESNVAAFDDVEEINDKNKANKILDEYIFKNRLFEYIQNKYKYLEFRGGSGGVLSMKRIQKNKYYAIVQISELLAGDYKIIIQFCFVINTKKEKIRLKRKSVILNTLPKKFRVI